MEIAIGFGGAMHSSCMPACMRVRDQMVHMHACMCTHACISVSMYVVAALPLCISGSAPRSDRQFCDSKDEWKCCRYVSRARPPVLTTLNKCVKRKGSAAVMSLGLGPPFSLHFTNCVKGMVHAERVKASGHRCEQKHKRHNFPHNDCNPYLHLLQTLPFSCS